MAMTKQFKIKSFDDLIEFIQNEDASLKDIEEIVRQTMCVIVLLGDNYDKSYLIEKLKNFRNKYRNGQERPLFIMEDLD